MWQLSQSSTHALSCHDDCGDLVRNSEAGGWGVGGGSSHGTVLADRRELVAQGTGVASKALTEGPGQDRDHHSPRRRHFKMSLGARLVRGESSEYPKPKTNFKITGVIRVIICRDFGGSNLDLTPQIFLFGGVIFSI